MNAGQSLLRKYLQGWIFLWRTSLEKDEDGDLFPSLPSCSGLIRCLTILEASCEIVFMENSIFIFLRQQVQLCHHLPEKGGQENLKVESKLLHEAESNINLPGGQCKRITL